MNARYRTPAIIGKEAESGRHPSLSCAIPLDTVHPNDHWVSPRNAIRPEARNLFEFTTDRDRGICEE